MARTGLIAISSYNNDLEKHFTFTLPNDILPADDLRVRIATGGSVTLESIKLELGSISTLAIDPPMDYGKELTVCKRYQIVAIGSQRIRTSVVLANEIWFLLPLPVQLRISPPSVNTLDVSTLAGLSQTGFTWANYNRENGLYICATKTAHGLTDASMVIPTGTIFDANL